MAKKNAAKLVGDAILGNDTKVVSVAGKAYVIQPPTIAKLAGAASALSSVAQAKDILEIITKQTNLRALACALSYFIQGDDKLTEELMKGEPAQISKALTISYNLLNPSDFLMPSLLAKNVARAVANQRR